MYMKITDVPVDVHRKFKALCAKQGVTMNQKLLEIVAKAVKEESNDAE